MNKNFLLILFIYPLLTVFVFGQLQAQSSMQDSTDREAASLLEILQKGNYHGSFRGFFMATDNKPELSDYYAIAAGGSLYFNTARFHGFSFSQGGMFNYNISSSDLLAKDSITGAKNRYEIGLFDVENPDNKKELSRVERFALNYNWKNSHLSIGRQFMQSPFINFQDGRMRPTVVSGILFNTSFQNDLRLEGGWIWGISPRSTVRWYDIGKSIGIYPKGLNPDGTGSGYPENLSSAGIGILGVHKTVKNNTQLQFWNQYVDKIFNTSLAQIDQEIPFSNGRKLRFGLQYTFQTAIGDGGNPDADKTYFQKGKQSHIISTQTAFEWRTWQVAIAYTRVGKSGRFLAPREWGREPFYTFMARERIEGSGDSHSFSANLKWQNKARDLQVMLAYGQFYLPDVLNTELSKYAFPSFRQANLDIRYKFKGFLKGLSMQTLVVHKFRTGNVYGLDKYMINKVDMSNYNLILNYNF